MPNDHEHAVCGEVLQQRTDIATVIQADREAAAYVAKLLTGAAVEHILEGFEDDTGTVQAFARHRIASVAALTAEVGRVRAETIEACAKVAEDNAATSIPLMRGFGTSANIEQGRNRAGNEIAAAIRALAGGGA